MYHRLDSERVRLLNCLREVGFFTSLPRMLFRLSGTFPVPGEHNLKLITYAMFI
jgi:hypothetical protein